MADINGIPYVESSDLVSAYPAVSQSLAQEVSDQLASKLPYSYGTATPSTTDSGFLWYDSNSTPPVPKYWNGSSFATLAPAPGLELITAETFTAQSSVSLNGCFTSDYQNYRIMATTDISTSGTNLVRLRASGTDNTSASYDFSGIHNLGATAYGFDTQNGTSFNMVATNTLLTRWLNFDIYNAQSVAATRLAGIIGQTSGSSGVAVNFAAVHTDAASFDGISFIAGAGTISGTIRVYGYKD